MSRYLLSTEAHEDFEMDKNLYTFTLTTEIINYKFYWDEGEAIS